MLKNLQWLPTASEMESKFFPWTARYTICPLCLSYYRQSSLLLLLFVKHAKTHSPFRTFFWRGRGGGRLSGLLWLQLPPPGTPSSGLHDLCSIQISAQMFLLSPITVFLFCFFHRTDCYLKLFIVSLPQQNVNLDFIISFPLCLPFSFFLPLCIS